MSPTGEVYFPPAANGRGGRRLVLSDFFLNPIFPASPATRPRTSCLRAAIIEAPPHPSNVIQQARTAAAASDVRFLVGGEHPRCRPVLSDFLSAIVSPKLVAKVPGAATRALSPDSPSLPQGIAERVIVSLIHRDARLSEGPRRHAAFQVQPRTIPLRSTRGLETLSRRRCSSIDACALR